MPYCNSCGASVPDNARFCQVCGSPIIAPPGVSRPAPGPIPPAGAGVATPPPGERPPFLPPSTLDLRPVSVPADLPFHPQTDEVIYREIIPHPRLRWRLMIGGLLSALVFLVFIVPLTISFVFSGLALGTFVAITGVLVGIFVLIVAASVIYATLAYRKFRYWITNHRTVGRRGVIGYSIDSIPLETISDVIVQRSIADRILGLSSIWVQPFGGTPVGGYGAGQYQFGSLTGTNSFLGLMPPDATRLQQLIFYLRDVRRRETGRLI